MREVTREDLVREARSWLGTPFFHTGREKGLGVDCVGLLIGVGRALGLFDYDFRAYPPIVPDGLTRQEVSRFFDAIPIEELQPGDALLFRILGYEQHVAFYAGDGRMIHAYRVAESVVEHDLTDGWRNRITSCWRLKQWKSDRDAWQVSF